MSAGYSVTPLARKLGYRDAMVVWRHAMPASVAEEIEREARPEWREGSPDTPEAAHVFASSRSELEMLLAKVRAAVDPDGFIWVSWPKKAAKVETDITEDVIREIALPMGLVDVKVCAVDAVWSGLKLVIRKALRGSK
ncbi:MAG: DUF3052 family protein [Sphingomonadaceae bacterium]|nr:DUF3052 family protein [Sphingomonadaceae bacterium]